MFVHYLSLLLLNLGGILCKINSVPALPPSLLFCVCVFQFLYISHFFFHNNNLDQIL